MIEVPLDIAHSDYPGLVMAALGGIEKSDDSFRVIHDGSHGVKVNQRIRPRDQMRFPGIAEKSFILSRSQWTERSLFGIKAVVKNRLTEG